MTGRATNEFRQVTFDTASDGFGGNENDRTQVKYFVSHGLGSIALAINGAVILCAHPSRSGIETGRGDSGSTGWNGAFRSRLYMDMARDADGKPDLTNLDVRSLELMKANYASRGVKLNLRYRSGAFVRERDPNEIAPGCKRSCEDVFLALLDEREKQTRPVSDSNRAPNYAPKEFALFPKDMRDGYDARQFTKAMASLFAKRALDIALYKSGGKDCKKIVRMGASVEGSGRSITILPDGSEGSGRSETISDHILLN